MQIDVHKLNLERARSGKRLVDLGIDTRLMRRIKDGRELRPQTIHRLAAALCCDPAAITKAGEE